MTASRLRVTSLCLVLLSCLVWMNSVRTAEETEGKREPIVLDLVGGVTLTLNPIPVGKFLMGSPADGEEAKIVEAIKYFNEDYDETQHEVTISKHFYMGIYPVTQAQYEAVMGNNPSFFNGATLPVERVIWDDAVEFCKKLSEKTGRTVRLPTEAEWEYSCRAGTTTAFSFGETLTHEQANFDMNKRQTTPVGSYPANGWGLYDMHKNVFEWCYDWYKDKYPEGSVTDPRGPEEGEYRVLRGASWLNNHPCRSAQRNRGTPDGRVKSGGFRVVLD